MMRHTVIIGGGYAGMLAAARIARAGAARVTLIDAKDAFVQRIRLHELLAGSRVAALPYQPLLARRGIAFRQARVEGIDVQRQALSLAAHGRSESLNYDTLLIGLGSATASQIPGVSEHALMLNDARQVAANQQRMRDIAAAWGRVLVIGGGLTGIETACELATRLPGLRVALACSGRFAADYSPAAAGYLRDFFARAGIELFEQTRISAVDERCAYLSDGGEVPFDACVWAGGFAVPSLMRDAGLPVDAQGRVYVTPELQVRNNPTVFAAGDSAVFGDANSTVRMGCVSAMPMGVQAGENIAALLRKRELKPLDFGFLFRCVSLGRREGVVQFTDAMDRPTERVLKRRGGALVKELICQMTFMNVRDELRTRLPLCMWMRGGKWWERPELAR